jgi:hypothetical protein
MPRHTPNFQKPKMEKIITIADYGASSINVILIRLNL